MKIYEKPSVDVRTFDVEDVMFESGVYSADNDGFDAIMNQAGQTTYVDGVVFQW